MGLAIQDYYLDIIHCTGKENATVDALSRFSTSKEAPEETEGDWIQTL